MKILLTGAQGVGKTTLIDELLKTKEFKSFKKIGELTRTICQKYFNVPSPKFFQNTSARIRFQKRIFIEQLFYELKHSKTNCLVDRGFLDFAVYTEQFLPSWRLKNLYIKACLFFANRFYDYIIYIEPFSDNIVDDGVRSINKDIRSKTEKIFKKLLTKFARSRILILREKNLIKRVNVIKSFFSAPFIPNIIV